MYAHLKSPRLDEPPSAAQREDAAWIATSESALDRAACRAVGICGGTNWLRRTRLFRSASKKSRPSIPIEADLPTAGSWTGAGNASLSSTVGSLPPTEIPGYVLEYAPYVYLHPDERFWPSDPAEHLRHVDARYRDGTQISAPPEDGSLSLANLAALNRTFGSKGGEEVYLTARDDPEDLPAWITSEYGIPEASTGSDSILEQRRRSAEPSEDDKDKEIGGANGSGDLEDDDTASVDLDRVPGRSRAPVVLIVVPKADGIVDAFWFYFYSYNLGNTVLGIRFGNHVGDWEHSMVRFHEGVPKAVYTSRHGLGNAAFQYEVTEKIGKRPVIYCARGSHANYVTPGTHAYIAPLHLLSDSTARGPLWDPSLNMYSYALDLSSSELRPSQLNPDAPTSWFHFTGRWGDRTYKLRDRRQYRFFGEYHYSDGPTGPRDKKLARQKVCEKEKGCVIKDYLDQ